MQKEQGRTMSPLLLRKMEQKGKGETFWYTLEKEVWNL